MVAILPRLKEAIRLALPVIAGSLFSRHRFDMDWTASLIGILTGLFAIGAYWTTRFDIHEGHVSHRTGWIFRKDRRIPLEQIQNVNLRQTFLERVLGVATVDVETARGHGHDLKLSVMGWKDAERFRDELLTEAHLVGAAPPTAEPLVRLSRHDLMFGALTESHLAPMFVFLFTFGGPVLGVAESYASSLPFLGWMAVFCGALALAFVGSWLWGAGSYVLKYGDFTVTSQEHIFRISYGLLNKVQMAVRPSRIEYLRISKTLPQRWLDRASFHVGTAASFGEAGLVAPVALYVPLEVAYRSAADVIPGLDLHTIQWRPFHPNFYGRAAGRTATLLIVLWVIARMVGSIGDPGLGVLTWSIYGFFAAMIAWRLITLFLSRPENAFAVTDEALVVRQGWYTQRITAMPIWRMENVAVTQPAWWRRRGAAQISVQGMKHRVSVGAAPVDAIEDLLARWRTKIAEVRLPFVEVGKGGPPIEPALPDEAALSMDLESIEPTLPG